MKDPLKALVQLTVSAGLYRADGKAQEAVAAKVREREQSAWASEPGKRLTNVRNRIASTNQQILAAKSAAEQAEASHFAALSGDSDAAIESARTEVLANQNKLAMLQGEAESLKVIAAEARAAFGGFVEQELPVLYGEALAEAQAKQTAALNAILKVFEANDVHQHLKSLAEATEALEIIGSGPHALRIACDSHNWSQLFGRPLPPNHVSLKSSEFDKLDAAQLQNARVRV